MSTKPDALLNLADAMAEDILNTPDDEILRETKEDYGDPRALANKFDQILERTEKQVFVTARAAAFAPVRSSVPDLPISLPDETIRRAKSIFDLVSRLSEFLSSLRPRTLAWSATAAAIAVFIPAAVITAVVIKEQGAPSSQAVATSGIPDVMPRAGLGGKADRLPTQTALAPMASETAPMASEVPKTEAAPKLNDKETVALVAQGRKLIVEGKIAAARLVLQQAAEAGNAAAALELGATYDPMMQPQQTARSDNFTTPVVAKDPLTDIATAKAWYEKARDLGSAEAAERLKGLR